MVPILLQDPAVASWEDYRTAAVRDGIGYRSNLIDPRNPYASSERRNFGVLLARLGMIEDWTDIDGGPTPPTRRTRDLHGAEESRDPAYSVYLREILGSHAVDELFPRVSTEDCDGRSHRVGRKYMQALPPTSPIRCALG